MEISFFFLFLTAAVGATYKKKIEYYEENVTARVCVCVGNWVSVSECGRVCVRLNHATQMKLLSSVSLVCLDAAGL